MSIQFGLEAKAKFKGGSRVVERFKFTHRRPGERGTAVETVTFGDVDAGIINIHADEYALFKEYVEKNESQLFEEAKKTPGVSYFFEYRPKKGAEVKEVTTTGLFGKKKRGKNEEV